MGAILQSIGRTVIAGLVLLVIVILIAWQAGGTFVNLSSADWWRLVFRWLHVLSGVMWIGLLWYFNFVQTPAMPKIPDELKPAVGKFIAPSALFWFRWGAASTVLTGLILAGMNGYLAQALSLQRPFNAIGLGMWFGLVMAFNVWFIIWPAQKKVLGMVAASAEEKAAAARRALLTSRLNTLMSIPLLYFMVAQQNGGL